VTHNDNWKNQKYNGKQYEHYDKDWEMITHTCDVCLPTSFSIISYENKIFVTIEWFWVDKQRWFYYTFVPVLRCLLPCVIIIMKFCHYYLPHTSHIISRRLRNYTLCFAVEAVVVEDVEKTLISCGEENVLFGLTLVTGHRIYVSLIEWDCVSNISVP